MQRQHIRVIDSAGLTKVLSVPPPQPSTTTPPSNSSKVVIRRVAVPPTSALQVPTQAAKTLLNAFTINLATKKPSEEPETKKLEQSPKARPAILRRSVIKTPATESPKSLPMVLPQDGGSQSKACAETGVLNASTPTKCSPRQSPCRRKSGHFDAESVDLRLLAAKEPKLTPTSPYRPVPVPIRAAQAPDLPAVPVKKIRLGGEGKAKTMGMANNSTMATASSSSSSSKPKPKLVIALGGRRRQASPNDDDDSSESECSHLEELEARSEGGADVSEGEEKEEDWDAEDGDNDSTLSPSLSERSSSRAGSSASSLTHSEGGGSRKVARVGYAGNDIQDYWQRRSVLRACVGSGEEGRLASAKLGDKWEKKKKALALAHWCAIADAARSLHKAFPQDAEDLEELFKMLDLQCIIIRGQPLEPQAEPPKISPWRLRVFDMQLKTFRQRMNTTAGFAHGSGRLARPALGFEFLSFKREKERMKEEAMAAGQSQAAIERSTKILADRWERRKKSVAFNALNLIQDALFLSLYHKPDLLRRPGIVNLVEVMNEKLSSITGRAFLVLMKDGSGYSPLGNRRIQPSNSDGGGPDHVYS